MALTSAGRRRGGCNGNGIGVGQPGSPRLATPFFLALLALALALCSPCCRQASAATPVAAAAAAAPPRVAQVLHRVELPRQRILGLRPVELSALAWAPAQQQLWGASDRGGLFAWQVNPQQPERLRPLGAWTVRHPAQQPTPALPTAPARDEPVNAETLAWQAAAPPLAQPAAHPAEGSLWLGGEHEAGPWQLSPQGQVVATRTWPGALHAPRPGAQHGVEAMSWHPVHGWLAARQRTVRRVASAPAPSTHNAATRWHVVHGQQRSWHFAAAHPDSQLKAIETLGTPQNPQGLLLLERIPLGAGVLPVLRWLALDGCVQGLACTPHTLRLQPALPASADNYEGLACTADGLCWLVSDAPGKAGAPTRLLVVQLQPWSWGGR